MITKMKKLSFLVLVAGMAAIAAQAPNSAWAQPFFTGAVNNDWNTGGNWSGGLVPSGGDFPDINANKHAIASASTPVITGGIEFSSNNAQITVTGAGTVMHSPTNQFWGRNNNATLTFNVLNSGAFTGSDAVLWQTGASNVTMNWNVNGGTFEPNALRESSNGNNREFLTLSNGGVVNSKYDNSIRTQQGSDSGRVFGTGTWNMSVGQAGRFDEGDILNARLEGSGGTLYFNFPRNGSYLVDNNNGFPTLMNNGERAGLYATGTSGRLKMSMPDLTGTSTAWGERRDDVTLDVVNSLRVTGAGLSQSQEVPIELVSLTLTALPQLALLTNPIGAWNIGAGAQGVTGLQIRYDDNAAGVNEPNEKLLYYNGASWAILPNQILDIVNNRISADTLLPAGQYAVATGFEEPAGVPEPSTYALGLIGLAGLGLFAWRRRRLA